MRFLIKHPLWRKRLQRFRAHRRAWWSLRLLVGLYVLSLGAELLCNDRPLLLRFEGRWYVPVLRYYPEDTFTGSGLLTRTDYKALRDSPAFADTPGNLMLFPLVPHGPYQSANPAAFRAEETVTLTLTPIPRVASLNVDADWTVRRAVAAGPFFDRPDTAIDGLRLTETWAPDAPTQAAVERRLVNQAAPAFEGRLAHRADPERFAVVRTPAYTPRAQPPQDVRLTLSEAESAADPRRAELRRDGAWRPAPPPWWDGLPASLQTDLHALALRAFDEAVYPEDVLVDGRRYRVRATPNTVAWPHRPVAGHWMGLDSSGRDVLARIVYGFRISVSFGLLLVLATMVMGTAIGAIQGYFGGLVDLTAQRLIEIWSALPFLYVMILLGSVYGRGFGLLLVCYGIFNWIGISYYIRAEFLRLRRLPYVEAARCQGVTAGAIMRRHLLPNAITPLITFLPFSLVGAIASLYGLDYLGFGLPPPTPSWGELLHQAQQFRWAWWLILYPAAAVFTVMLLGVFIGEGIRDAFDPRPFGRME